jgi:hypothetical protein
MRNKDVGKKETDWLARLVKAAYLVPRGFYHPSFLSLPVSNLSQRINTSILNKSMGKQSIIYPLEEMGFFELKISLHHI